MIYLKDYLVPTCYVISVVGAGHARDEGTATLQSSPKCRGRGTLLQRHCLLNLMAVTLRVEMQSRPVLSCVEGRATLSEAVRNNLLHLFRYRMQRVLDTFLRSAWEREEI
jgi:hypothetical protein